MFPTTSEINDKYVKTIHTKAGDWRILRRGAFYGPNASGKTSLIKSIAFAKDFILSGTGTGKGTGVNQFKGNFEDLEEQSVFQFMFLAPDGEIYEYGFALDKRQVYEEWLLILTEKDFVPLFERATDKNGKTQISIEAKLARKNSKDRELAEVLKNSIQEKQRNQLFLYKLYDNGVKKVNVIIEWFQSLHIIFPNTKVQFLPIRISRDSEFQQFVSDSLSMLDTGVMNVSAESDEMDFHDFAEQYRVPQELVEKIEEQKHGMFNVNGKYYIFGEKKTNSISLVQVKFKHLLNGQNADFDLEEESDGTQRLLDLLPILFAMDKKNSGIYFVDEIDRSLHTRLSSYLLKEFLNKCTDTNFQILFTAHDVNLINLDEFAQDEIWFVEKNSMGETGIRPLSDFEIQKDQDVLKAYLNGRFGAVPNIKGGR
jgi:AAA15 family ATPase/GTPase